jgi:hypothetical protein
MSLLKYQNLGPHRFEGVELGNGIQSPTPLKKLPPNLTFASHLLGLHTKYSSMLETQLVVSMPVHWFKQQSQ